MKTYLLSSEDFTTNFNISEIDTLSPAIYNVYENGSIKHHHYIVVSNENIFYVTSFERAIDIDFFNELNENTRFFIETKEVKRHLSTFTDNLNF